MRKSLGFTLAEVLITLAIIGVVAAMTIPSVIVNTNQSEFKTGLKKAVSVLNSSITMNVALEGETPYDNADLFSYLQQHMSIMKTTDKLEFNQNTGNLAFYTTDGMRFEIPSNNSGMDDEKGLHEASDKEGYTGIVIFNQSSTNKTTTTDDENNNIERLGKCGSLGLVNNPNDTTTTPCLIMVDVNGDRKPNPANQQDPDNTYVPAGAEDKLLKDIFSIMITDEKAVPFGVVAQKAMYHAQK